MDKFITDLVIEFKDGSLTNHDIQDIIEGYCLMNDTDYEEVYRAFRERIKGV